MPLPCAAPQGQKFGGAEEALEPIVVETNVEPMSNQTRGNAVEHAPQHKAAARRDQDARVLIVGRAALRKSLERRTLDLNAFAVAGVAASDGLVHKAAVGGQIHEVARAPQQKLVAKRLLQMSMGALDRSVLVRDAAIVARRRHAVMGAQLLVTSGEVVLGDPIEIAERRRQAVAAVLFRRAAQRPQRVLQAFRERDKISPPRTTWACSKPEKASRKW